MVYSKLCREAFSVLKAAGCSDEALCYEMCVVSSTYIKTFRKCIIRWMSKEPAEIFERAAEDGFVGQVHPFLSISGRFFAQVEKFLAEASLHRVAIRSA